jgi:hypothetical protein
MSEHLAGAADLGASESDRASVAAALRTQFVAGRLSLDEFERRVGLLMSAETSADVRALVVDLPREAPFESHKPSMGRFRPGVRPFLMQVTEPVEPDKVRRVAVETLAPALTSRGFELVRQAPGEIAFIRTSRPLGLRGLFVRTEERVTITFERRTDGGTLMVIFGRAAWSVRSRFASLSRASGPRH